MDLPELISEINIFLLTWKSNYKLEYHKSGNQESTFFRTDLPNGLRIMIFPQEYSGASRSIPKPEKYIRISLWIENQELIGINQAIAHNFGWRLKLLEKLNQIQHLAYSVPKCEHCGNAVLPQKNRRRRPDTSKEPIFFFCWRCRHPITYEHFNLNLAELKKQRRAS